MTRIELLNAARAHIKAENPAEALAILREHPEASVAGLALLNAGLQHAWAADAVLEGLIRRLSGLPPLPLPAEEPAPQGAVPPPAPHQRPAPQPAPRSALAPRTAAPRRRAAR